MKDPSQSIPHYAFKRYRLFKMDFDSRANILNTEIKDNWTIEAKENMQAKQNQIIAQLRRSYGEDCFDGKLARY
ncbi:hypothetical protein HQ520_00075 [bacterium]|nr:hypothetical protein [bacterium]